MTSSWEPSEPELNVEVGPDGVLRHEEDVVEGDLGLHLLVVSDDGGEKEVEESKEDEEDHEKDEDVGKDDVDMRPILPVINIVL